MVWRTMVEWNQKGKSVIKGTKCLLRDPNGTCLFNEGQVEKRVRQAYIRPEREYKSSRVGYYAQSGGNYQKHDYDYDDYDIQ